MKQSFREYRYLLRSDLYRISDRVDTVTILRHVVRGSAFKYNFWMRTCRYTRANLLLRFLVYQPRQTAGPFYTPETPKRTSLLEPGIKGTPILITGTVLTTDCKPVANTLLDFWQADDDGEYDNAGFKLRGHQFTDEQGRYRLETIVPGMYPGRTRHIHVRVQAANQRAFSTQLYFPGEPANDRDGIFDSALLMEVKDKGDAKEGTFTFVLPAV